MQVSYYRRATQQFRSRFGAVPRMSVKANVSRWTLARRDKMAMALMERLYGKKEAVHNGMLRVIKADEELDKIITDKKFVESVKRINKDIRQAELDPIEVIMTVLICSYVCIIFNICFSGAITGRAANRVGHLKQGVPENGARTDH